MIISQKQLAANRRNALQSTGPVTQERKATVRLNALRYGLRACSVLLPGENAEEYSQLCTGLEADWNPQTRTEQLLVEQMAVAQWKLARLEVGERSIFAQGMPAEDPARPLPPAPTGPWQQPTPPLVMAPAAPVET